MISLWFMFRRQRRVSTERDRICGTPAWWFWWPFAVFAAWLVLYWTGWVP